MRPTTAGRTASLNSLFPAPANAGDRGAATAYDRFHAEGAAPAGLDERAHDDTGTTATLDVRGAESAFSGKEELLAYASVLLAAGCWAISLPSFRIDPFAMNGFGLLSVAPLPWFVAAVISAVAYVTFAVRGNVRRWPLMGLHASLVAVLYGTTAVLYDYPRATWTYKHIGVVEYLLAGNGVDRSIDIYHNWPGFFLISALVTKLTGLSPMTQARIAEPLCGLVIGLAVYYAVGGLTRSRRLRWAATALFTVANWIGQGYFAPQALATLLQLVLLGAVLRSGVIDVQPRGWVRAVLRRLRLDDATPTVPTAGSVSATVIAIVAFALLVTTHQLTPIATLMQLAALAVLYRVRRWWVLAVMVGLEVAWMAYAWDFTSLHYRIVSFDPDQSVRMPTSSGVPSLPGMGIAKWGGPVICAMVALLAVSGLCNRLRRRVVPLAAMALAGAPMAIFAMNSYGSEALLRVYLYSLPWLALLGATFLVGDERSVDDVRSGVPRPRRLQQWRTVRAMSAAALLIPVALNSNFWMERSYILQKPDIQVATFLETWTEPDSFVVMVDSSYPSRLTGDYVPHMITDGADAPVLTSYLTPGARAEDVLVAARKAFRQYNWRPGYLAFSPSQKVYAQMWGWIDPAQYDRAMALVRASRDYQVVYQSDGAMLARYRGVVH